MKLLIDGYNVIFGCGLYGKHATPESLANGRNRLLQEITNRLPKEFLPSVTVVFDAKRIPLAGQIERESFGPIVVLYSIHYPDADALIEKLMAQHSSPKSLKLVSSDHRLQNEARHQRAHFVDSDIWYFEELHSTQDSKIRHTDANQDGVVEDEKETNPFKNPFPQDYLNEMKDDSDSG